MSLLLKVKPLVVSPELATRIGLPEAIVLQQICYWLEETPSGIEKDGKKWVYNTHEQWGEQFPFWSTDTVKRALNSLKKLGLIYVEQLNKSKHDRTNFYAINYESPLLTDECKLPSSNSANSPSSMGDKLPSSNRANTPSSMGGKMPSSLTENTTENTTEITGKDSCQVAAQPDDAKDIVKRSLEVLWHLNKVCGAKHTEAASSMGHIKSRITEGFTAEELRLVVDYKHVHWEGTTEYQYMRPKTLFIPGNLPGYLQSAIKWDKAGQPPRSEWNNIKKSLQRDVNQTASVDYEHPNGWRGA